MLGILHLVGSAAEQPSPPGKVAARSIRPSPLGKVAERSEVG